MNIYTVAENLKRTIAGKEGMLMVLNATLEQELDSNLRVVTATTAKFLETNLIELRAILKDVEECCEQHNEMSWQLNPERMGR